MKGSAEAGLTGHVRSPRTYRYAENGSRRTKDRCSTTMSISFFALQVGMSFGREKWHMKTGGALCLRY